MKDIKILYKIFNLTEKAIRGHKIFINDTMKKRISHNVIQ